MFKCICANGSDSFELGIHILIKASNNFLVFLFKVTFCQKSIHIACNSNRSNSIDIAFKPSLMICSLQTYI